jgi:dTDP-glucose 4,6-dehydratase
MRTFNNILVTGGAGFIGTNFIKYIKGQEGYGRLVVLDNLTYAGNYENIKNDIKGSGDKLVFVKADISDIKSVDKIFLKYNIDCVIHFAAESHVDKSISGPAKFINTNIIGTFNLLETARSNWAGKSFEGCLFHHISTDEVFGSLGNDTDLFYEDTRYDPRSPYSASKASSDHLVRAYWHTYKLPVTLSNCSNNYGPYQFPEKLIPLAIYNLANKKKVPVYGKGLNIRDWLFVEDHVNGIWKIVRNGKIGESYNIGGENEWKNIDLIKKLCAVFAKIKDDGFDYESLIQFVEDRKGHDLRYAINCDKIKKDLDWKIEGKFEEKLFATVEWYLSNMNWVKSVLK